MKNFQWSTYTLASPKIRPESGELRLCMLSDLHGFCYGEGNRVLLRQIQMRKPDGILIGGDMVLGKVPGTMETAEALLKELVRIAPVWYAYGNHEHKMQRLSPQHAEAYREYERTLAAEGVAFLHNRAIETTLRGSRLTIYGLELPQAFFRKPTPPELTEAYLQRLLRTAHPAADSYSILLAHSPKFADTYFRWGADLTLCGHYHGGIVRFSKRTGLAAPQDLLFPKYCCGDFYRDGRALIVSAGLGEHTLPLRIHNPREILELRLRHGQNKEKGDKKSLWRYR